MLARVEAGPPARGRGAGRGGRAAASAAAGRRRHPLPDARVRHAVELAHAHPLAVAGRDGVGAADDLCEGSVCGCARLSEVQGGGGGGGGGGGVLPTPPGFAAPPPGCRAPAAGDHMRARATRVRPLPPCSSHPLARHSPLKLGCRIILHLVRAGRALGVPWAVRTPGPGRVCVAQGKKTKQKRWRVKEGHPTPQARPYDAPCTSPPPGLGQGRARSSRTGSWSLRSGVPSWR